MNEKKHLPANPDDACDASGTDSAEPSMIYDSVGKKFWWRNRRGEWVGRDKAAAQLKLKKAETLSAAATSSEKLSPLDDRLLDIMETDCVDYVGRLAGWKQGFYDQGMRFLCTHSPALPVPEAGDWPTLKRIFAAVLGGVDLPEGDDSIVIDQSDFFFAWWRHGLESLRDSRPTSGLAMCLAGDAGSGKTLLKELVKTSFGGREVYAYAHFIGRDNFNGEMIEAELLTIDDETADTSMKARLHFGAEIKKVVANSAMRFRGMMREATTLTTFKRLFICVNREPDRLMVVPPLDDDIKGKLSLLLAYNSNLFNRIERNSTEEKKDLGECLEKELPHFMYWLLNEFEPGEELHGRFGCRELHHPELLKELFTLSPEQTLLQQIDRTLVGYFECAVNDYWEGSAQALLNLLSAEDSPLSSKEVKLLPQETWVGRRLKKLAEHDPGRIIFKKTSGGNLWRIYPPLEVEVMEP